MQCTGRGCDVMRWGWPATLCGPTTWCRKPSSGQALTWPSWRDSNVYQRQAWLYRTCKNLFLDEQRRHRRQETLVSRLGENIQSQYAGEPSPGTLTQAVLDLVPDRYRDLLYDHYLLGKTSEEIARELNIPPATVRSRLHLAVVWLRQHWGEL